MNYCTQTSITLRGRQLFTSITKARKLMASLGSQNVVSYCAVLVTMVVEPYLDCILRTEQEIHQRLKLLNNFETILTQVNNY